jgi:hypothetical protein
MDRSPAVLKKEADAGPQPSWLVAHLAGLIALVLGVVGFAIVSMTQKELWSSPDWRLTVPFLAVTVAAATVSFIRKERSWALPLLGIGFAAAAVVLGWFLVMAIVIAATAIVILVLHMVM